MHAHTYMYTHTDTCTHAYIHVYTHGRTHTHPHMHAHSNTTTDRHTHKSSYTHTNKHIHIIKIAIQLVHISTMYITNSLPINNTLVHSIKGRLAYPYQNLPRFPIIWTKIYLIFLQLSHEGPSCAKDAWRMKADDTCLKSYPYNFNPLQTHNYIQSILNLHQRILPQVLNNMTRGN